MSSNNLMEFFGALTAAASAGKLPSTKQSNELANYLLKSPILQLEESSAGCGGKLSENGSAIIRDIREIVEAGQALATEKNGDDLLQKALFTLGRANQQQYGQQQQQQYGQQQQQHGHQQQQQQYGQQQQQQYGHQQQQQYGQQQQQKSGGQDFVAAMRIGVEALLGSLDWSGRQQQQGSYGQADNDYVAERLSQALDRIVQRAQNDQEYRRGIDTLFFIYDKFKTSSINRAQQYQQPTGNELQEELANILGGGEISNALQNIRTLIERFSGGKSLQNLLAAAAVSAAALRQDQEVRSAVDDFEGLIRRALDEPRYIESDGYRQRRSELRQQWERLRERNSEAGRQWNQSVERVERESREFNKAVEQDRSVQRIRNAHLKLVSHVANISSAPGKPAAFVLSDLADAILPRVFAMIKGVPLPRTEHSDNESEFVLENLKIQSLQLPPGQVKITDQPQAQDKAEKTRIQFDGIQLKLDQVQFYYKDKTSSGSAPNPISGLLDMDAKLKADLQVSVLPSDSDSKQRQQRSSFLRVDQASVSIDNSSISLSKTNHPVSSTIFKSTLRTRLENAVQKALEQYLQMGITMADSIAFNVNQRAQIFADSTRIENALGAHALALTSVLESMAREGRLLGSQATSLRPGSEQQRVKGEGVPAEAPGFMESVGRLREAELRREGWQSGAYEIPAGLV
jgi:hypothetical protein